MARPIDYSKWKDIEISDDEDDTHPNIDTPSLFKWRHEARVQRMQQFQAEKKAAKEEKEKKEKELEEIRHKLRESSTCEPLKKTLAELEKEKQEAEKKWDDIQKEEKLKPWNVDTISQEGFSKTKINKSIPRSREELSEEEKEKRMKTFVKNNEKDLKAYGWLKHFDDSKKFLLERPHLACEETANYLVIHCLNLAMEEKLSAMEQVAHQCICMQYLLELSKQLDLDPRSCISSFFTKIQVADPDYLKAFDDELEAFKDRIRRRSVEKIEEQMEEARQEEEKDRQARLGPGGLDPVEVFETLPNILKECFESQNIGKLQEAIRSLPEADARYHMKRCVDAGLWVPSKEDAKTNPEDGFVKKECDADEDEEAIYETADSEKSSNNENPEKLKDETSEGI